MSKALRNRDWLLYHFNDFFVEIGDKLASAIPQPTVNPLSYLGAPQQQSIFLGPVTPHELTTVCIAMLKNSSPGHDGIRADIIKSSLPLVCEPSLSTFLQSVVCYWSFPLELKLANVIPIFKLETREYLAIIAQYLSFLFS